MTEKMLARVAVSSVPYAADRLYTYLVPDELIGSAEAGKRVTIPFGRGNRRVEGFLLEVGREAATSPLKPIDALLDDAPLLDAKDIRLVRWMKARYFCTYYDAIKTILPGGVWLQYRELWHVNGEISAEDALSSVAPDSLGGNAAGAPCSAPRRSRPPPRSRAWRHKRRQRRSARLKPAASPCAKQSCASACRISPCACVALRQRGGRARRSRTQAPQRTRALCGRRASQPRGVPVQQRDQLLHRRDDANAARPQKGRSCRIF